MQGGTIDGKIKNTRAQVIFDGSNDENWSELSQNTGGMYRYVLTKSDMENAYNEQSLVCNRFTSANNVSELGTTSTPLIGIYSTRRITICTDISTLSDFKTWLSNNPILLEYPLITPDETDFTQTQLEQYKKLCEAFPNETNLNDYLV